MNQEMTPVPENIRYENAPSKNLIDEAFSRGLNEGCIKGYTEALADIVSLLMGMQKKFLDDTK